MKKIKFLGLVAVLAASTAIAADNISADNKSCDISSPYSVKLGAGVAIPANSTKLKELGIKLKNKVSPAVTLTFGYDINDINVNANLGFMQLKNSLNKTQKLSGFPKIYGLLNQGFGNGFFTGNEDATLKVNARTTVFTYTLGANYYLYNDGESKLFAGLEAGMATKKFKFSSKFNINNMPGGGTFTDDNDIKTKRLAVTPVFGGTIGGQYRFADNADLHLAYSFKDLGKGRFKSKNANTKYKLPRQSVHLITAGVSYSF